MGQFKLILIFVLFIVSTTYSNVARPFNLKKWNFKKDIDLAYVLMYDLDNGILIKSQDRAGEIKSQEVLAKLNKLNAYSKSLQQIIKKRLVRSRFQKEVQSPLLKIIRKYKFLTRNYKNKRLIENPEYTKLIVEKSIQKALFLENYFKFKLKNLKPLRKLERMDSNQSSLKRSLKDSINGLVRSKFSNSKPSKRLYGLKKCNKRRGLNNQKLNNSDDEEFLDELDSEEPDELENELLDELDSEELDELDSEELDELDSEDIQEEDEFS
ncbi:membrane protein (plasmid) [Borreliella chilensis]|uniref:Membrane protein n=1 Tax=Borreliella chilensis TaxID=1245910 RepID=A0A0A7UWT7_9SPIR|nr:membrane protein [Borreliella chilensis]